MLKMFRGFIGYWKADNWLVKVFTNFLRNCEKKNRLKTIFLILDNSLRAPRARQLKPNRTNINKSRIKKKTKIKPKQSLRN